MFRRVNPGDMPEKSPIIAASTCIESSPSPSFSLAQEFASTSVVTEHKHRIVIALVGPTSAPTFVMRGTKMPWYEDMMHCMCTRIQQVLRDRVTPIPRKEICLVISPQPWMCHIGVMMFLSGMVDSLVLTMPCAWDARMCQFDERPTDDHSESVAILMNNTHRHFQRETGINSLMQVGEAIKQQGSFMHIFGTEHVRWDYASLARHVIALTYTQEDMLGRAADYIRRRTGDACIPICANARDCARAGRCESPVVFQTKRARHGAHVISPAFLAMSERA